MKKNNEVANYSKLLEKARKATDVKEIIQTYMKNGNCFKCLENTEFNIQKEDAALRKILGLMVEREYNYDKIEDALLRYTCTINTIYPELGIKVGFRLVSDFMYRKSDSERGEFIE